MAENLNIDEAVASGITNAVAGTSGLGATTNTATASTPPIPGAGDPMQGANTQTGRGFGAPTLEQPEWAWRPTQDDFGQVDVRRGQYDTGMVPTVNVQHPFPALANRQEALAQRKAALAQKVANFDRYAGLGSAPDPYLQNFGKLARGGMDQFVRDIADSMYGGDMNAATRGIMESPELMARFKSRAASYNEIGQQGQGWFDGAEEFLKGIEGNEANADPELVAKARRLIQGIGEFGGPNGPDPEALAREGQAFESRLSMDKAFKDFVVPGLEKAMVTLQGKANIKRGIGGKIIVETTKTTDFENLKEQMAREWARSGIADSYQQAREYLDSRLGFSKVTETKLESINYAPEYMMRGSGDTSPAAMATASVINTDTQKERLSGDPFVDKLPGYKAKEKDRSVVINPAKDVSGRPVALDKETVFDNSGNQQVVAQPAIVLDRANRSFKVTGRLLDEKTLSEFEQINDRILNWEQGKKAGNTTTTDEAIKGDRERLKELTSKGKLVEYPASQNEASMMRMIGFRTPEEWIASQYGVPLDNVKAALETDEGIRILEKAIRDRNDR